MIVVDSSALVAIVLKEPLAPDCMAALKADADIIMSAVVLAEVMVVAQSRGFESDVQFLIESLGIRIIPADEQTARLVMQAYNKWGKGRHKASLNLVDCFSYVTAMTQDCPLLFVGNDFSQTDIVSAL